MIGIVLLATASLFPELSSTTWYSSCRSQRWWPERPTATRAGRFDGLRPMGTAVARSASRELGRGAHIA